MTIKPFNDSKSLIGDTLHSNELHSNKLLCDKSLYDKSFCDGSLCNLFNKINRKEAVILLADVLNKTYSEVFFGKNIKITEEQFLKFQSYVKRRLLHEPIAKIIEYKEFYGIRFKTTKDTLDPRPETELLIDLTKKYFDQNEKFSVLDLGCGTGCIGLTIAKIFSNVSVDLCDISKKALEITKYNMKSLNLENRCNIIHSNWFDNIHTKYDLIVSNPPYIANDYKLDADTLYDPDIALYGGINGLDAYYNILSNASKYLKKLLMIEIGFDQAESITHIKTDLHLISIFNDLSNHPRVALYMRNSN